MHTHCGGRICVSDIDFSRVSFYTVSEEQAGQRLDNFLIKYLKGVPKSRIYRLVRKGEVRINKGRARADSRIVDGDILRIAPIRVAEARDNGEPGAGLRRYLNEHILFEDEGLLIINKPSGLAVHGGSGIAHGVIEALRAERPGEPFLELVHRLDRDTSGCLMLAKKRAVLLALQQSLIRNRINKSYQALVKNVWPRGKQTINAPLLKNQLSSGERVVRVDGRGKQSITHFEIAQRFKNSTLLNIKLETGRTHQIRVHCQFAGHPLAGDVKYGDQSYNDELRLKGLNRLFLHACSLRFEHPLSDEWVEVEAPLPNVLKQVLSAI